MKETGNDVLLDEVAPGVWVRRSPFQFLGLVHIGTKMTVLRLDGADGAAGAGGSSRLVIHSPIPITPDVKEAVDALGDVSFIVAPNLFHHVYASQAVDAWPKAKLLAPRALGKKRRDLKIHSDLESGAPPEWKGAIEMFPIHGTMLEETVLHHRGSKTLVAADLFENFTEPVDHGLTRAWLKLGGIYGKAGWHRLLRLPIFRDRKAAKASIEPLLDLGLERVVLSHGEIITSQAGDTMREALRFLLA